MKPSLILLCSLSLVLFGVACGRSPRTPAQPKLNTTVPELDFSKVDVQLENAEIIQDPEGAPGMPALKLSLKALNDLGGKTLVLDTYDSKAADSLVASIPMPASQDGLISITIPNIEMWQFGKGVFRLVEPAR
ncbi:MAG: hypothetical protein V2A58_06880 [Planctomycetota bacterium]